VANVRLSLKSFFTLRYQVIAGGKPFENRRFAECCRIYSKFHCRPFAEVEAFGKPQERDNEEA
jgi:hypothetical protein